MASLYKYFVKESWIFNLEAMRDKLYCIGYDLDDGVIEGSLQILGYLINSSDDIIPLLDECGALELAAKRRKVTSVEYGRIKEIVNWRVNQRYITCLNNGLSERDAGECFSDV